MVWICCWSVLVFSIQLITFLLYHITSKCSWRVVCNWWVFPCLVWETMLCVHIIFIWKVFGWIRYTTFFRHFSQILLLPHTFSDLHLLKTRQSFLSLQLQSFCSVGDLLNSFLLCPLMFAFMFDEQQYGI